jgi:hypothetical protein
MKMSIASGVFFGGCHRQPISAKQAMNSATAASRIAS